MHDYIMVVRNFPHFIFIFSVRRFIFSFIHSSSVRYLFNTYSHTPYKCVCVCVLCICLYERSVPFDVRQLIFILFHLCSYEFMCTNKFLPSLSQMISTHEISNDFNTFYLLACRRQFSVRAMHIKIGSSYSQTAVNVSRMEERRKRKELLLPPLYV